MIEDVGPTAKKNLIYVEMSNLLTKDVHVNLTVGTLNTQKWIVSIYNGYNLVINKFLYDKCSLSLLYENILYIATNTVMFKKITPCVAQELNVHNLLNFTKLNI